MYKEKYFKYKQKYLDLTNNLSGGSLVKEKCVKSITKILNLGRDELTSIFLSLNKIKTQNVNKNLNSLKDAIMSNIAIILIRIPMPDDEKAKVISNIYSQLNNNANELIEKNKNYVEQNKNYVNEKCNTIFTHMEIPLDEEKYKKLFNSCINDSRLNEHKEHKETLLKNYERLNKYFTNHKEYLTKLKTKYSSLYMKDKNVITHFYSFLTNVSGLVCNLEDQIKQIVKNYIPSLCEPSKEISIKVESVQGKNELDLHESHMKSIIANFNKFEDAINKINSINGDASLSLSAEQKNQINKLFEEYKKEAKQEFSKFESVYDRTYNPDILDKVKSFVCKGYI
jgi:hypothetical protein